MALHWQENTPKNLSSGRPSYPLGFMIGIASGIAFSLLLTGLILGYTIVQLL